MLIKLAKYMRLKSRANVMIFPYKCIRNVFVKSKKVQKFYFDDNFAIGFLRLLWDLWKNWFLKPLSNLNPFENICEQFYRHCLSHRRDSVIKQFITNKPHTVVLDRECIFVLFIEVQLFYWIIFLQNYSASIAPFVWFHFKTNWCRFFPWKRHKHG